MDQPHRYAILLKDFNLSIISNTSLNKIEITEDLLKEKYTQNMLSMRDIAKQLSCSKTQVRKLLIKYKIPIRGSSIRPKNNFRTYGNKKNKGHIVHDRKEAQTIKIIKNLYSEGMSTRSIARILDSMRIPTKNNGKSWHNQTIISILTREGIYKSKKGSS